MTWLPPAFGNVGNTLLRGLRSNTNNVTVPDPASSVYRGVALGYFTAGGDYSADLTAAPGRNLRIYVAAPKVIGPTSATAGSGNVSTWTTDTGVVDVLGPGALTLNSRIGNDAVDDGSYEVAGAEFAKIEIVG